MQHHLWKVRSGLKPCSEEETFITTEILDSRCAITVFLAASGNNRYKIGDVTGVVRVGDVHVEDPPPPPPPNRKVRTNKPPKKKEAAK